MTSALGKTQGRGSWKFQEMRSVGIPSCPNSLQGSMVPAPLLRGRFLLPLCPPLCHRGQRGNGKPDSGHPEVRKRRQSSSGSALQLLGLPLPRPPCAPLGAPPPQQNGWGSSPSSLSTATCLAALDCCPLWTSKFTNEKGSLCSDPTSPWWDGIWQSWRRELGTH